MKTMDEDEIPDKSTFLPFADLVARHYHLFDSLVEYVNNGVWSFPGRLLLTAEVPKDEKPSAVHISIENMATLPNQTQQPEAQIALSKAGFWDSELSLVQDYIKSREIDQPRPTAIDIGSHPTMAQESEVNIIFEPWELSILKDCVKTMLRNYDSPTVMDSQALLNPNQEPEAEIVPSTAKFANWELAFKDDIETMAIHGPESTFMDVDDLSNPTQDPEAEIALSATEIADLKLSLLYYNNDYNEKMEIDDPSPTAMGMEAQPNIAHVSEVQTALLATENTGLLPLVQETTEMTEIDDPISTVDATEAYPNMAQETGDLIAHSVTENAVSEPPTSPNSAGTVETNEPEPIIVVIKTGPNPTQEEIDNKSIIVQKTGGKLQMALTKSPLIRPTDKMLRNRRLQLNISLEGNWFRCPECPYKARLRYIVSSHYHAKHLQFLVYNCNACAFKSFHRRNVNRHYHSEHINLNRTNETRNIETTGWVVQVPLICVGEENCKLCKFIAASQALPGHERANGNVAKILKCVKRILPFHVKPP